MFGVYLAPEGAGEVGEVVEEMGEVVEEGGEVRELLRMRYFRFT